jgi:hypothetical protein
MLRQDALDVSGAGLLTFIAAEGAVGVPVGPTAVALGGPATPRAQAPETVHTLFRIQRPALPTLCRWLGATFSSVSSRLRLCRRAGLAR